MSLGATLGLSLTLCAVFTYALLRASRRLGWGIDATRGVPRVGGLAIIACVALLSVLVVDLPHDAAIALGAAGVVAVVGLLDDLGFGRGPLLKLTVSLAAAAVTVALTDVYVSHINTPILSQLFEYTPFAIAVSILALAGMCHGVNLIDGLHGLALSFAVIAFVALTVIAQSVGEQKVASLALCLAGACLGLMAFNFPSGSIFTGDVGSYFLGFVLAWIAIYLCHHHAEVSPWAMLCIFAYPIVDVGYSAGRRMINGQNPLWGDRQHFHHRVFKLIGHKLSNQIKTNVIMTTTVCATFAAIPAILASLHATDPQTLQTIATMSFLTLAGTNFLVSFA